MHGVVDDISFWVINVELFLNCIPRFICETFKEPPIGPSEAQKGGDPELSFADEPRRTTFAETKTAVIAAIALLTTTLQAPAQFNNVLLIRTLKKYYLTYKY